MDLINPVVFINKKNFIRVDEWEPSEEDMIFKHCKGAIVIEDILSFYNVAPGNGLELFILSQKRSYNSLELRNHLCLYLNYFEKFYDTEKELLAIYYRIKYLIDYEPNYDINAFIYDIKKYILQSGIYYKASCMNNDNYNLNLTYRNKKNPGLQYTDKHGGILMMISVLMNIIIPLLTHFIYVNKISNSNNFLLQIFDILLNMYDVDIYNKLYETSISNINRSGEAHSPLWDMQDIRGNNITTHSISCVNNIILNIMPKYTFDKNWLTSLVPCYRNVA